MRIHRDWKGIPMSLGAVVERQADRMLLIVLLRRPERYSFCVDVSGMNREQMKEVMGG